jgi:hypothetical protein
LKRHTWHCDRCDLKFSKTYLLVRCNAGRALSFERRLYISRFLQIYIQCYPIHIPQMFRSPYLNPRMNPRGISKRFSKTYLGIVVTFLIQCLMLLVHHLIFLPRYLHQLIFLLIRYLSPFYSHIHCHA